MAEPESDVVLEHPNRDKASSKVTKLIVILLLLVSVGLMLIVTFGGWDALVGAKPLLIGYIALYLVMAYYIARWKSGVLAVSAALAIILLIFAAVAAPEWFSRDKDGFTDPTLDEGVLGLVTMLIIPVQVLLILFSMRGFQQKWQVEVERHPDGSYTKSGNKSSASGEAVGTTS